MDLTDKKILVVGLARTGVALSRFLAQAGAVVTVSDQAPAGELMEARAAIKGLGIIEDLGAPQPRWRGQDLVVLSPGVPPELPWVQQARAEGLEVWGELEVASHFIRKPLLAVSGTNGKTTTTTLVGALLTASGRKVLVGGNIGTPLISLLAAQESRDCLVAEVSSFQLDTAPHFHPQAAALLNLTPDHLDRYPDFAAYVASKAGLFRRQGPKDLRVLNRDDPAVQALGEGESRVYYFSARGPVKAGAWLAEDAIRVAIPSWEGNFPQAEILLSERHNLENIMAALLLALEAGADPAACREVLARFRGLPHRLEWVADIDGVEFYDDSKGTNVGAVARSLAHFARPVVLIAGGRDKESDFSLLSPLIRDRVKALVLLGEAREQLRRVWDGLAPAYLAADLEEAVNRAFRLAQPGEVVLLSPACASFDMFRDYAQRGETFQRLVRNLQDVARS